MPTQLETLVIDDDATFNSILCRALTRRGLKARGATTPDEALAAMARHHCDQVVLDLNLNGTSGLTLIPPLLDLHPDCRIVILTGYASITTAVDAIKLGAVQYLAKPVEVDAILAAFDHQVAACPPDAEAKPLSMEELEWEHIQRLLKENDGNISATARALNIHRRTLQRKLARKPE